MSFVIPRLRSRGTSRCLIDLYTFNYGYMGSRTTGNGAACSMIAGPSWKGDKPEGIAKVFQSETDLSIAAIRTQLFNAADLNFLLQFTPPTGPAEVEVPLRARFAQIGVEAGKPFAVEKLTPEKAELEAAMKHGIETIKQKVGTLGTEENGWRVTLNGFGDRQAYAGDWLLLSLIHI